MTRIHQKFQGCILSLKNRVQESKDLLEVISNCLFFDQFVLKFDLNIIILCYKNFLQQLFWKKLKLFLIPFV